MSYPVMPDITLGNSDPNICPYPQISSLLFESHDVDFIHNPVRDAPSTSRPISFAGAGGRPGGTSASGVPSTPAASPDLTFLDELDNEMNHLRVRLYSPSTPSQLRRSARAVADYSTSRGRENAIGMRKTNKADILTGQVWRPVTVVVTKDFLKLSAAERKSSLRNNTPYEETVWKCRKPYLIRPAALDAESRVVWRDIYDFEGTLGDQTSCATALEMCVAGRAAYNWLSRRHRAVISSDMDGYIGALFKAGRYGESVNFNDAQLEPLPLCARAHLKVPRGADVPFGNVATVTVAKLWFALLLHEVAGDTNVTVEVKRENAPGSTNGNRNTTSGGPSSSLQQMEIELSGANIIFDHDNRIVLLHVRGSWGGDIHFRNGAVRRRSELLNFVPHDCASLAFGEIRTCPCAAETIMTSLAGVGVHTRHVAEADVILRNPGLVHFPFGIVIFNIYVVAFIVMILMIFIFSFQMDANGTKIHPNSFTALKETLEGVSLAFAVVTAFHFAITKNVFPRIEFAQLAQRLRYAKDLDDLDPSQGTLICIAHDHRANYLLAPGNACAYAHRPAGPLPVPTPPSIPEARLLGVIITSTFALKIDQGTPLICETIRNLDGSMHVDWDRSVTGSQVGAFPTNDVRVG